MLLLLAGTSEARALAEILAAEKIAAIASHSGATRDPAGMGVPTRRGGFGGDAGFEQYLRAENITAVLDATHPFAAAISARTARICGDLDIPHLQLMRPGWVAQAGDRWTCLAREEDAAAHIPVDSTVFLATGRKTLDRFANLSGRRLICRQIDPPDREFPFGNGEFLVGRPPFSVAAEVALFKRLAVDWLVVKNAGGEASRSKLVAARQLQIPVAMLERPPLPDCARVETVEQAMDWVRRLTW